MQDVPDTSLAGKDLSGQDLRGQDLSGKVLFDTDLRGAKLYGMKISLECQTFDGVKLDDDQMTRLLLMIAEANSSAMWKAFLHGTVINVMGLEKYMTYCRLLRVI